MKEHGGPALIIGIGKPKRAMHGSEEHEDDEDTGPDSEEGGVEEHESDDGHEDELDMHADQMFECLQNGDKEGFKEALRKCLMAEASGDYEE